ncbi:S1C family serine protease [Quadrisphaera sp. KR29]|uniref:S1C family serine protease n=1 Tax=Quadrisphaera sp. KR29 TaxID=3461391 RepID=UPI0040446A77
MSHDTHSPGPGAPGGQNPSWAPPGEGWVGSGHTGPQPARDPYRPVPTAPQAAQEGQHPRAFGGGPGHGGHRFGGQGTATAPHPGAGGGSPWYGTPASDPDGGGGHGTGGASRGSRGRRGPGWGGVVAVAALAALIAGGGAFGLAKATDQTAAPASASSTVDGSSGSGGAASSGGTAGQAVPIGQSVDWGTVAKAVEPSVVTIQVSDGQRGGEGTGVVFDTEGHVVTNNHVATAATGSGAQIRIILSDGRVYQGEIAGTDPSTDLAVIQIQDPPSDLKPATFGDSSQAAVGQGVMAIGNPLGLQDTVTTGIISATDRPVTTQASESQQPDPFGFNQQQQSDSTVVTNALQTDAAINPGNSGGPLVDARGQVIGINSSIASTSDGSGQAGSIGLGFAIPGNEVKRVATELIQTGTAEHARLGVSMTSESSIATVDGTSRQAAEVAQVVSGGAAASAGIQQGDFITAVDDRPVTSAESLTAQVRSRAPGDTVTLTVVRGGQEQDVQVQLGSDSDG